jgi:hypothetical protein
MNFPRYDDYNQDLDIYYCQVCRKEFYYYEELEHHDCTKEEPQK